MVLRARLLSVSLAVAVSMAACSGGGPTSGTYVGRLRNSNAFIALVSNGKQVAGYLCDGQSVSTWFAVVRSSGNKAELESRQGAAFGEATFTTDAASGHVSVDGSDFPFTAGLAAGKAGLYRAVRGALGQPGSVEVGWIVLPDGSQRGGTNLIDQAGTLMVQMAPMLNTSSSSVTLSSFGTLAVHMVDASRIAWTEQASPY